MGNSSVRFIACGCHYGVYGYLAISRKSMQRCWRKGRILSLASVRSGTNRKLLKKRVSKDSFLVSLFLFFKKKKQTIFHYKKWKNVNSTPVGDKTATNERDAEKNNYSPVESSFVCSWEQRWILLYAVWIHGRWIETTKKIPNYCNNSSVRLCREQGQYHFRLQVDRKRLPFIVRNVAETIVTVTDWFS